MSTHQHLEADPQARIAAGLREVCAQIDTSEKENHHGKTDSF